jgi:N-acetylglucosamine-6-sulfatase
MSIGDRFLNDDGSISPEVMPDYLHLSPKGYEIWADALRPRLVELMKPI